jgi:hypothetical protein
MLSFDNSKRTKFGAARRLHSFSTLAATNHYLLAAYIKFLHVFNQGCRVN